MTIFESFKKRFAISEWITDFMFAAEHAHKSPGHVIPLSLRSGLCSCMGFSYFPFFAGFIGRTRSHGCPVTAASASSTA